ncbi:hypothetical protein [Scytonema millei]|uniref:Uncharacterized protein n=1 Tax=Scytonema millei VB511283 TaxID=1245923 RepID=A0A9X5E7F6_9CYAN|nr:hypothetical protein [Scytonema millei]NHC36770.1 hypothetical protein [Scytonema millei VB511283]
MRCPVREPIILWINPPVQESGVGNEERSHFYISANCEDLVGAGSPKIIVINRDAWQTRPHPTEYTKFISNGSNPSGRVC